MVIEVEFRMNTNPLVDKVGMGLSSIICGRFHGLELHVVFARDSKGRRQL